jgi:hypothetical protein
MEADTLARAYATLASLKANLPVAWNLSVGYLNDYIRALDHLEQLGVDVTEFRIPAAYINDEGVDRDYLLVKLNAILTYFELRTQRPEQPIKQIGFRPPGR